MGVVRRVGCGEVWWEVSLVFFFQAEDGIRDLVRSRGLGDVYKRQPIATPADWRPGERIIVAMAVSTEDAKKKFDNVEELKPYLRLADAPR